jgi:hypothetical protein
MCLIEGLLLARLSLPSTLAPVRVKAGPSPFIKVSTHEK